MSIQAVNQMQYLELIKFVFGNKSVGDYWQRLSGGEVTVAVAEFKRANRRGTTHLNGRYTVSAVNLERDYIPDGAWTGLADAIIAHLQNPGETENAISIVRVMPNSPLVGGRRTTIRYINCTPQAIPNFTDADVTSDQGSISNRIGFAVDDLIVEVPQQDGKIKKYDTHALLSAGWDGTAAGLSSATKPPRTK